MKRLVLRAFGEAADVVELITEPARTPGPGELLVKMEAAPVNPSDFLLVRGMYAVQPTFPFGLGAEGVGHVTKIGPGGDRHLEGLRVLLLPTYQVGTWSDEIVVPARDVVTVSDSGDPLQLAMLGINPATAYLLLSRYTTLMPGDWVGQTAGSSAMGQYVIALARLAGVRTLSVVRSEGSAAEVRAHGGDRVVVAGDDLEKRIGEALDGKSLNLVLDPVGGDSVYALGKHLREGGTIVGYGLQSGELPKLPMPDLYFKNQRLAGFWLMNWLRNAPRAEVEETYDRLAGLVVSGELTARVDAVHSLEEWQTALARSGHGGRKGKVLFRPG